MREKFLNAINDMWYFNYWDVMKKPDFRKYKFDTVKSISYEKYRDVFVFHIIGEKWDMYVRMLPVIQPTSYLYMIKKYELPVLAIGNYHESYVILVAPLDINKIIM